MSRIQFPDALQSRRQGASDKERITFNDTTVDGYAILWDSPNDYGEVARRGCCAKSLKERGIGKKGGNNIRFLLQHDWDRILGKLEELREDGTGLYFKASIYKGLSYSSDAIALIEAGELRQLSYGFRYVDSPDAYEFRGDYLYLKQIDLIELSLVTFSSDPAAQLRGARSAHGQLRAVLAERSKPAFGFTALAGRLFSH